MLPYRPRECRLAILQCPRHDGRAAAAWSGGEQLESAISQQIRHPHRARLVAGSSRVAVHECVTTILRGIPAHRQPFVAIRPCFEQGLAYALGRHLSHQIACGLEKELMAALVDLMEATETADQI
jgi:hypothetical protein